MSDTSYNHDADTAPETAAPETDAQPTTDVKASDTPVPAISGPKDVRVGDDELPEVREVQAEVLKDEVDAQVVQERVPDTDKVQVHEVSVTTDERVNYVIVPDAGRGDLTLPLHRFADAEKVEDVFAREASKNADED